MNATGLIGIVRRLACLLILGITLNPTVAHALDMERFSMPFMPILTNADLYDLRDAVYWFPANLEPTERTRYLALRRWDIIFTGDRVNVEGGEVDSENINRLIPGPFNHIMVYMGKDASGLAYAIELNAGSFFDTRGIKLLCLGSDYGLLRHLETHHVHDRDLVNRRWAKRFDEESRQQLLDHEGELLARLQSDLVLGFPYQLEFYHSGSLFDFEVLLVDDGFEGGAGCSDYWTTLFETYAGLCLKGVRLTVEELEAYFLNDPQGLEAYAPAEINPFGFDLPITRLIELGFRAVADEPHTYSCDGTQESGVVIPSLIIENPNLEDAPARHLPFPVPGIVLQP